MAAAQLCRNDRAGACIARACQCACQRPHASRVFVCRHARSGQDHGRAHPGEMPELRTRRGECASCRESDAGRSVDLIEVDAASRTRVDDTRELLDNVQYAPTRSRYKIYLIDEVHMLAAHSFNALLKSLEKPPPHVKFLLATTEPQKLPVTVLSRCLQFNLKRLPVGLMAARLQFILKAENLPFEPAAVQLLAQAGDGSLR